MPMLPGDVIPFELPRSEIHSAITFAFHALVHAVLEDDPLELYIRVLMEELAERMVTHWLKTKGKVVEPKVDKGTTSPDLSHEVWLTDVRGKQVLATIHSLFSTTENEMTDILSASSLSIDAKTLRGINIAVVYWLPSGEGTTVKTPSLNHAAIIGWASDKNFRELPRTQAESSTNVYSIKLKNLRPLDELTQFLV